MTRCSVASACCNCVLLQVMLAMEAQNIQSAVTAPLPTLAPGVGIRRNNLPADLEDQQGANLTNPGSQEVILNHC